MDPQWPPYGTSMDLGAVEKTGRQAGRKRPADAARVGGAGKLGHVSASRGKGRACAAYILAAPAQMWCVYVRVCACVRTSFVCVCVGGMILEIVVENPAHLGRR